MATVDLDCAFTSLTTIVNDADCCERCHSHSLLDLRGQWIFRFGCSPEMAKENEPYQLFEVQTFREAVVMARRVASLIGVTYVYVDPESKVEHF